MIHKLGQTVACFTDATHGMSLAAVSMPYYRYIMPYGVDRFARFARYVWEITGENMSNMQLAAAGLDAMEQWMEELGVTMNLTDLGVTEDMIGKIADATIINKNGYKVLDRDEVEMIYHASL